MMARAEALEVGRELDREMQSRKYAEIQLVQAREEEQHAETAAASRRSLGRSRAANDAHAVARREALEERMRKLRKDLLLQRRKLTAMQRTESRDGHGQAIVSRDSDLAHLQNEPAGGKVSCGGEGYGG